MDKEEAKLILGCYRPNGKDALDPEMRQALEMAEHDPELAEWFKREQALDGVICEKVCECKVPESLKTSIIAGRNMVSFDPRKKTPQLLALAAMLVAVIAVAVMIVPSGGNNSSAVVAQQGFSDFRAEMVDFIHNGFELDVRSGNTEDFDMWFMKHSTPFVDSVSTEHLAQNAMGCKALNWDGKPVSLMCYRMGEGKVLHLFVMDLEKDAVDGLPQQETKLLAKVNELNTASWQENGKAYLLVGHNPGTKVTPFL